MGDRRAFLKASLAGLLCAGAGVLTRRAPASTPQRRRPRYLVIIQLSGGPDAILTLDPKTEAEVIDWVDNPLPRDSITAGPIRLGAHFAPLAKWAPKMAILPSVRVESVNHFAGSWQLVRMRRRVLQTTPGILDIIARHRDTQPLGALTVGDVSDRGYTPSWTIDGFPFIPGVVPVHQGFAPFEAMAPEDLAMLARALRENAAGPSLKPADRDSYTQVAAFLERLPQATKYTPTPWITGPTAKRFAATQDGMQRILWGFENDMITGGYVTFTRNDWDSHYDNLNRQTNANAAFVQLFDRFLTELATRKNEHGTLAEQTTIVVSGELGRYPRINSDKGKDHYPEMPMLLMGAGINTGDAGHVIGQTDKDMLGVAVDPATGKLGGTHHLVIDDIGTTLLRLFGVEPTRYGYFGRPIEALLS